MTKEKRDSKNKNEYLSEQSKKKQAEKVPVKSKAFEGITNYLCLSRMKKHFLSDCDNSSEILQKYAIYDKPHLKTT
jgi:hypothetical protein